MAGRTTTERITDHLDVAEISLQGVLEALVDPVRRGIVCQLAAAGQDVRCGTFDLSVNRTTATHHFKVLRQAGILYQYYEGTAKMNTLRRADLDTVLPGLLDAILAASGISERQITRD